MVFRLHGVGHAFWLEPQLVKGKKIEKYPACTAGSIYWEKDGRLNELLVDIGFGVWQNWADLKSASKGLLERIKNARLWGIVITHAHIDHYGEIVPFVESARRMHPQWLPLNIYGSAETLKCLVEKYPWIFRPRKGAVMVNPETLNIDKVVNLIDGLSFRAITADSHCSGGLNYIFTTAKGKILVAWDMNQLPELAGDEIDVAFVDGNTFEPHETGHCCIQEVVPWARRNALSRIVIVHYSGWEDGLILDQRQRQMKLKRLLSKVGTDMLASFGKTGEIFSSLDPYFKG